MGSTPGIGRGQDRSGPDLELQQRFLPKREMEELRKEKQHRLLAPMVESEQLDLLDLRL